MVAWPYLVICKEPSKHRAYLSPRKGSAFYFLQFDGNSQNKIYDKAKLWMVSTLKSGDNMVELGGDETKNRIVGIGNIQLEDIPLILESYRTKETYLNFKFIILCKEDRYKNEVSNFTFKYAYLQAGLPYTVSSRLEELEIPHFMGKKSMQIRY
ncbi:MAG: DUF4468 domain-containing protein [Bacteroidota bacterium]